ncbi:MAG: leucine-rich repeat protein [Rikenellaceae bacterium]
MKRVMICVSMVAAVALTVGCGKDEATVLEGFENGFFSLSEVSAERYPATANSWKIDDTVVSSVDEFYGLRDALYSASAEGRKITITADSINKIPSSTSSQAAAFYNCDALVSISLASVSSVGDYAFGFCDQLSVVSLPAATSIGEAVFFDCDALLGVSFSELLTVGDSAFEDCSMLQSVELPEVVSIGASAFLNCDMLSEVSLPEVAAIGSSAFRSCDGLVTIDAPKLTEVGDYSFAYCSATLSHLYIASYGALESISSTSFNSTATTNITLHLGLGNSGYVTGSKLSIGGFSASFAEIFVEGEPDASFSSLSHYSASSYPEYSNYWTFDNTTIATVSDLADMRAALKAAGNEGRKITLVADNLKSIPEASSSTNGAFYGCSALIGVSFASVESVGDYAFSYCNGVKEASFGSATSIGSYALYACSSLETLLAPSLVTIGGNAFCLCTSLAALSLPKVTTIEYAAFKGCEALTNVEVESAVTFGSNSFGDCPSLLSLIVALDSKLESLSSTTFSNSTTTNIALKIGAENSDYVNGTLLTFGDFSGTFKSISLQ